MMTYTVYIPYTLLYCQNPIHNYNTFYIYFWYIGHIPIQLQFDFEHICLIIYISSFDIFSFIVSYNVINSVRQLSSVI